MIASKAITLDIKICYYALLSYVIYGVSNIFTLNKFVVPLPMVFIIVPLIAVFFMLKSLRSYYAIIFLFLPGVIIKDVMASYHPNLVFLVFGSSLISWILFGVLILKIYKPSSWKTTMCGILLISSFFSLMPTSINLSIIIMPLIGVVSFMLISNFDVNDTNPHQLTLQRALLLVFLISGFYALTILSVFFISI